MKIGEYISQVKNLLRMNNADSHISDRLVYSLLKKHRAWLVRREDNKLRILRIPYIMQTLNCEDLVDVDIIECDCIDTDITIKRTKNKLPPIINGYYGPLIANIKSLDRSEIFQETTASSYVRKRTQSNFKYDRTLYYWFENGYIYFPNVKWKAVKIEAFFEDPLIVDSCDNRQDYEFPIPESIAAEMVSHVLQELQITIQIPEQEKIDKNENNK